MLRGIGTEALGLLQQRGTQATQGAQGTQVDRPQAKPEPSLARRFGDELREAADLVEKAESSATSMASGGAGSIETILALSRAELALRHVVSVRNRLLESYKEVMRLPL